MQFSDVLINKYHIPSVYIDLATKEQKVSGKKLWQILNDMNLVPPEIIAKALADLHNYEYFNIFISDFEDFECDREIIDEYKMIPIRMDDEYVTVGLVDPFSIDTQDGVIRYFQKNFNKKVKFAVISNDTYREYIERKTKISENEIKSCLVGGELKEESYAKQLVDTEKALRLLLLKGIYEKASDIHIEPTINGGRIRMRIHGTMKTIMVIDRQEFARLVNVVKIISNMNVAEKHLPQDGRIDGSFLRNERYAGIDFRISAIPNWTSEGLIESIVIRILDRRTSIIPLIDLGMDPVTLNFLLDAKNRSYGMIIFVGPTGSGKTTSIYSTMATINAIEKTVITVEDPVEYRNFLWKQIQVSQRLTFGAALRSILRHDPDILFCGEIRDKETAEIAFEMANTGHLVFTTLHANDSVKAIVRLRELGISRGLIESAVLGIVSQRLIKVLCNKCKKPISHPEYGTIYVAQGCPACNELGYKGRAMTSEIFPFEEKTYNIVDLALKENIIAARDALTRIYGNMYMNGIEKVKQGITTLQEIEEKCR